MRSEGNTGAHVGGGDVTVSTTPVVYEGRDELGDRHFHDLDNLGACRACKYGHAPVECCRCGKIKPLDDSQRCADCAILAETERRRSFESSHRGKPAPSILADDECPTCGEIECVCVDEPVDQEPEEIVELPDYIMAIALVMRDSEGHPDRAVRAARKTVVAALQGLNRVLRASTSPSRVDATPPDHVVDETPRGRRLDGTPRKRRPNLTDTEKAELKRRYEAGESTTELGKAFGMSATGVGNALRRIGTAMRDRGGRAVA